MSVITSLASFVSANAPTQQSTPAAAPAKQRANADIRQSYNVQISSAYHDTYKAKFQKFHDNEQCFGEDLAREAYEARSSIKKAHQAETSLLGRAAIWVRNMAMYGASNAEYEGLRKNKNPEEIAYSAFKTGGGNLGLDNNGFSDTLEVWHAIKGETTLYPEHITPAMVDAYKAQVEAHQQQPGKPDAHQSRLASKLDINAILTADAQHMSPAPMTNPFTDRQERIKTKPE